MSDEKRFWLKASEAKVKRPQYVDLSKQVIFPMQGMLHVVGDFPYSGIGQYRDATSVLGHLCADEWEELERTK